MSIDLFIIYIIIYIIVFFNIKKSLTEKLYFLCSIYGTIYDKSRLHILFSVNERKDSG